MPGRGRGRAVDGAAVQALALALAGPGVQHYGAEVPEGDRRRWMQRKGTEEC